LGKQLITKHLQKFYGVLNKENFEKALSAHGEFYKEVLEVTPVVTASEAMKLLSVCP
jgi:hypothetical protein